jgi:hypothetical protein
MKGDLEMSTKLLAEANLVLHVCPSCFISYAIPERMETEKMRDGTSFFCPNGHSLSYRDSEVEKLRKEVESKKKIIGQWANDYNQLYKEKESVTRSLSATKGVLTRTKKRISKGVCPCCNRHFVNLQRHMDGQHPEFAEGTKA